MTTTEKVAFATDDGSNINRHFGRLGGFAVYTINDGLPPSWELRKRPTAADRPGEHLHNHVALLEPIADCETLIAGGMGLPMAENVARSGIRLVLTSLPSIEEALASYLEGSLLHEPGLAHQPRH